MERRVLQSEIVFSLFQWRSSEAPLSRKELPAAKWPVGFQSVEKS